MDSYNWQTLLNDDDNFDHKGPYNLDEIIQKMDIVIKDLEHFNPYYVLSIVFEFTKFFPKISHSLGMGFSDIISKINLMRKLFNQFPESRSIQGLVENEISLGIVRLNGDNNDEYGHKKGEFKKYVSGARTFLRILWFMEFLISIFRKLLEDDIQVKEILKNSYEEVLAPRHEWYIRTGVHTALAFIGSSKTKAIEVIFNCMEDTPEADKKIKDVADELEKIWKAGHDYYETKGLLSLE